MGEIKDASLAPLGRRKISWVKEHMPVLRSIDEDFKRTKPFKGLKIALSIHLEAKTAYLATVIKDGGAEVYVTGSSPMSTQDDVAAGLAFFGVEVFGWRTLTPKEYEYHLSKVLEIGPNIIIDDGGDLVNMIHSKFRNLIPGVIGGCEQTTTGIQRLIAMNTADELKFPMMLVNNAQCKFLFDNRYGTGQSVWNSINRASNLVVAGKKVVVAGYGWCGKGIAMRAKGLGARVYITEIDSVKAIEAVMDGFEVLPMKEAAKIGDFFVTATGCKDVITTEHILTMKDGAILCNAGHFNSEIDIKGLKKIAKSHVNRRENIVGYYLENGRSVNVLADGWLVNLVAGDGHPAEIMDMSFAIQALCAQHLVQHRDESLYMLNYVPDEIDREVANRKLRFLGVTIDSLTMEQMRYIKSWNV